MASIADFDQYHAWGPVTPSYKSVRKKRLLMDSSPPNVKKMYRQLTYGKILRCCLYLYRLESRGGGKDGLETLHCKKYNDIPGLFLTQPFRDWD